MSDAPMHTVPGAYDQLVQIYTDGEALVAKGDYEGAVQKFSEGLAIDDQFRQRYITMYAQRAFALHRLGRLKEAINDYTKAIELEVPPENKAQYYFQRGMARQNLPTENQEEYEKNAVLAIADFGSSIELYPNHPGPYHLRAKLLVNVLGKFAEALPDLDKTLSLAENADAFAQRGFARFNVGRETEAKEDFERSNALSENVYNHYMLAVLAAKAGNTEDVIGHAKRVVEDPAYKPYFATHEDFEAFRTNPEFMKLIS